MHNPGTNLYLQVFSWENCIIQTARNYTCSSDFRESNRVGKPTPKTTHPNKKSLRKQFSELFVHTVLPLSLNWTGSAQKEFGQTVCANCYELVFWGWVVFWVGFLSLDRNGLIPKCRPCRNPYSHGFFFLEKYLAIQAGIITWPHLLGICAGMVVISAGGASSLPDLSLAPTSQGCSAEIPLELSALKARVVCDCTITWRCGNHPHPHKMRKLRPKLRPQRIWTARIQKSCKSVERRKLRPWSEVPPRQNSDRGPS